MHSDLSISQSSFLVHEQSRTTMAEIRKSLTMVSSEPKDTVKKGKNTNRSSSCY